MARKPRATTGNLIVVDAEQGNYFLTPNDLMSRFGAAMKGDGVSVYFTLKSYTSYTNPRLRLSYAKLATITGYSRRQVMRAIARLVALGLVRVQHRRRTDVNVYTILRLSDPVDSPPPASDSQSLVKNTASDSQSLTSDSQSLALVTNSHPLQEVVPKKSLKNTPPPPTPSPHVEASTAVGVAVVKDDVLAHPPTKAETNGHDTQGREAGATSVETEKTPFERVWDAYPHHRRKVKARAIWEAQRLDATLPAILAALAWQTTLTGHDALPHYADEYLANERWKDTQRTEINAEALVWDSETPELKTGPVCAGHPATGARWCDLHGHSHMAVSR